MLKEIIGGILAVISAIGLYGVFEKAGREGWAALIPGYDVWAAYETFWNGKYFYISAAEIIIGGCVLGLGMSFFLPDVLSYVCMIIGGLFFVTGLLMGYLLNKKISDAFGHNILCAIGLTLLPFIFFPLLGFSKDSYIGG